MTWKNRLYFGDNIDILRQEIPSESVDLVYLDPPFNSRATYNVLFKDKAGRSSESQARAFGDTWEWGATAERAFDDIVRKGDNPRLADLMQAIRAFFGGGNALLAYLSMMAARLQELRGVLKSSGSLYLHCDPTASHYLKLLLDAIFGVENFRNEITWKRTPFAGSSKARARQFPRSHDVILFYTKTDAYYWKQPTKPYSPEYLARFRWNDGDGRGPYRKTLLKTYSQATLNRLRDEGSLIDPTRPGAKHSYKQYLRESSGTVQIDDTWIDVNALNPVAKERLGYPTQKPELLLQRIIEASCPEDGLVMDPFCGCGTTIVAAERLARRWIGIDVTSIAIALIRRRLKKDFRAQVAQFVELGSPKDLDGAQRLAQLDRYEFQRWAIGLLDEAAWVERKGADAGVDGRINFIDEKKSNAYRKIVIQVKSGHVSVRDIRELKGVLQREEATIGVFITLDKPTTPMIEEAAKTGFYHSSSFKRSYERLQILTIERLLAGHQPMYPNLDPEATTPRALAKGRRGHQTGMF